MVSLISVFALKVTAVKVEEENSSIAMIDDARHRSNQFPRRFCAYVWAASDLFPPEPRHFRWAGRLQHGHLRRTESRLQDFLGVPCTFRGLDRKEDLVSINTHHRHR